MYSVFAYFCIGCITSHCIFIRKCQFLIGDFWVAFSLCFKASPSAKPFMWKSVLFTQILFHLHVNKTKRLHSRTHFETEAKGNSEITYLGHVILGLFRNKNSWNDQNNPSFSGLSWLQTCQNQLTVSLWKFYSHSGMRVAREWTIIVWLISTIPG